MILSGCEESQLAKVKGQHTRQTNNENRARRSFVFTGFTNWSAEKQNRSKPISIRYCIQWFEWDDF